MTNQAITFLFLCTSEPLREHFLQGSQRDLAVEWGQMSKAEPLADEELVARSRAASDPSSKRRLIGELFGRHQKRVALWCYRFTGDREAGADLAQDVFLKVYRKLDSFRSDSKFTTWLYSITRYHCLNYLQSARQRPMEQAAECLEIEDSSGQALLRAVEDESSIRFIQEMMDKELTSTEKTVMVLHYGEEMPLAGLTRMLQLDNPSGAKAYIVSAKRKLARALKRHQAKQGRLRKASASTGVGASPQRSGSDV